MFTDIYSNRFDTWYICTYLALNLTHNQHLTDIQRKKEYKLVKGLSTWFQKNLSLNSNISDSQQWPTVSNNQWKENVAIFLTVHNSANHSFGETTIENDKSLDRKRKFLSHTKV